MVAEAALWGLIGASALVIGAEVAFAFQLSSKIIGLIMAFGVGALISSISFELVLPALETTGALQVTLGLLIGALVFFVGDLLIERLGGKGRVRAGRCRLRQGDPAGAKGGGQTLCPAGHVPLPRRQL